MPQGVATTRNHLRRFAVLIGMQDNTVQLRETRHAFDSVAADYDGPRGNNALIQRMRRTLWEVVHRELPSGSRLLDLGCGTGIDALHFANRGYPVVATDWSPGMVARTEARIAGASPPSPVTARHLGVHQLADLDGTFDGIYSNFGPMNCVPDLDAAAEDCARLLAPGGPLVFSVMGRVCPWELGHYALRGRFRSEEHTSELQSPMRISYAVFCFKKKKIRHGSQARYYCRISDPHQRKWRTNKDEREYVVLKCELAEARED